MADPLSLIATIVALVETCAHVVQKVTDLKRAFSGAPAALHSLAVDCTTTAAVLQRLESLIRQRPQILVGTGGGNGPAGLRDSFELLVQGIRGTIGLVGEEVQRILNTSRDGEAGKAMSATTKAKFVWKETLLKDLLREVREQRSSLSFLLDCVHTESLVNVQIHLERGGSSHNSGTALGTSTTMASSSNSRPEPSQLDIKRLSLNPHRPTISVHLPRILDRPDVRRTIQDCRPRAGKSYKEYNTYVAEAMATAIEGENIGKLQRRLEDRRHPDTCLPGSKLTPLHRAIAKGWEKGAFLLVAAGADINTRGDNGDPALIRSIRQGFQYRIVKLMCELGADVNAKSSGGVTALHCVAMARKLLDYGCDPNFQDKQGRPPLAFPVEAGPEANTEIVKLLCDRGADLSSPNLVLAVVRKCPVETVKTLIKAGVDVNTKSARLNGCTMLQAAIEVYTEMVPFLVDHGADVNLKGAGGYLPIHSAVSGDIGASISVLECLLNAGSQVDPVGPKGITPLTLAASTGNTAALKILIKHGAYVDWVTDSGATPLVGATKCKSLEVARILIDAGADINVPCGPIGLRVIHFAALEGQNDLIRHLLASGADVDSRTEKLDITPLMFAVSRGHMLTFKLLLDAGADPEAQAVLGGNLLTCASNQPAMLRYLLSLGRFDVNHRDKGGGTALHSVVVEETNEMASARILLQKGANQFHADECWEDVIEKTGLHKGTPAEIAREMGKTKLAELIEGWKYQ